MAPDYIRLKYDDPVTLHDVQEDKTEDELEYEQAAEDLRLLIEEDNIDIGNSIRRYG